MSPATFGLRAWLPELSRGRMGQVTPEILGLVAAALILCSALPQLRSLLHHTGEGVSVLSWSLLLVNSLVWTSYGISIGSLSTVLGNVGGAIAFFTVVVSLLYKRTSGWWIPALVLPGSALVFGLAATLPTAVVGVLGVVLGVSLALPQLLLSYRTLAARLPSSVALGSWVLILAGQVLWLAYGLITGEAAIIAVNVLAGSVSAAVLYLETRHRDHAVTDLPDGDEVEVVHVQG